MTRQLYSVNLLSNIFDDLTTFSVTVPDGVIWVVRDIDATTYALGGDSITQSFTSALVIFCEFYTARDNYGLQSWRGRQVLGPGADLSIYMAGSAVYSTVAVSGYQLTQP